MRGDSASIHSLSKRPAPTMPNILCPKPQAVSAMAYRRNIGRRAPESDDEPVWGNIGQCTGRRIGMKPGNTAMLFLKENAFLFHPGIDDDALVVSVLLRRVYRVS